MTVQVQTIKKHTPEVKKAADAINDLAEKFKEALIPKGSKMEFTEALPTSTKSSVGQQQYSKGESQFDVTGVTTIAALGASVLSAVAKALTQQAEKRESTVRDLGDEKPQAQKDTEKEQERKRKIQETLQRYTNLPYDEKMKLLTSLNMNPGTDVSTTPVNRLQNDIANKQMTSASSLDIKNSIRKQEGRLDTEQTEQQNSEDLYRTQ